MNKPISTHTIETEKMDKDENALYIFTVTTDQGHILVSEPELLTSDDPDVNSSWIQGNFRFVYIYEYKMDMEKVNEL